MANISTSPIQEQSNPTNESRKPFDAELLAYIDQSLKTLIGHNNNYPIQNTAIPYLPPVTFLFNSNQFRSNFNYLFFSAHVYE